MGMNNNEEKDYARLIAAQNESERRLKIRNVCNDINGEYKKKSTMALISGICLVGVGVAVQYSGVDPNEALATEIKALNSFDALKEYLAMFTPAMWASSVASAMSITSYIKHNKKYKDSLQELKNYEEIKPENYLDTVEGQARNK